MGMIRSLSADFLGREVLRLEGVALPDGGVLAVLGKGGSGKSTFLRCLARRTPREEGWSIRLEGDDLPGPPVFVPQRLRSGATCEETWGPAPCRGPLPETCPHAQAALAPAIRSVTCGDKWNELLQEALESPAPLLLLDEPEGCLSESGLQDLAEALKGRRSERMVVLATHHVGFAEQVSDAAMFLEDGRKVLQAPRQIFFHEPPNVRVQEFLKWGG